MDLPKRVSSALLVLAWTLLSCGVANQEENLNGQDNWQTYTSDEGGFSILFPTKPTLETTTLDFMVVHSAFATKDGISYRASFSDLPDYSTQDISPDTILDTTVDQTIDQAVNSIDGKPIYKNEISFQSHPGREFKVESLSLNVVIIQRGYLVDNTHLYTQNAVTTLDNVSNSNINNFLDSFTLIE